MGIRGTSRLGGHGDTRAWGYEGQVDWKGMGIRGHEIRGTSRLEGHGIRGTSRLEGHGDTRAWGYEGQVDWEGMGIRGHGDTRDK